MLPTEPPVIGIQTTLQSLSSRAPFFYPVRPMDLIKPITTTEASTDIELDDPDIITLKSVLNDLAQSNSSFLTEILYGDYDYPDLDIHDMFKPTEKPDSKQHPLVNKSIFLIPELHEVLTPGTTEYVTIPLTTATTLLPNPFRDPEEPTTDPPTRLPVTVSEHITDLVFELEKLEILRSGGNKENEQNNSSSNEVESGDDTVIYYESEEDSTTTKTTLTSTPMSTKAIGSHHHHHRHGKHKKKLAVARTNEYTSDYYNDEVGARAVRDYEDNDYFGMQIKN